MTGTPLVWPVVHHLIECERITTIEHRIAVFFIREYAVKDQFSDLHIDLRQIHWLLFDQALVAEGSPVPNPARFAKLITALMMK